MNYKSIFFALLTMTIITVSCNKERLTKETQKGANTFSCKINGTVFLPCPDGLFSTGQPLYAYFSNNFSIVSIGAKCANEYPYKHINIELDNFHGVGQYLLTDVNNYCTYRESNPLSKYYKSSPSGKVIITKDDRANFIISGTFEFVAVNINDPSDQVTISSGRFDLKTN